MASTELVTLDQVEDVLLHGGEFAVVDSDAMQSDMIERILKAGSLGEAFAEFKTTPAEQVDGVLLDVIGIAWAQSSFDEGPAVYGLFKCVLVESGDEVTVSMGGRSLMASFVWAQRNKKMPIRGTFRQEASKSNANRKFWTFLLSDPGK